MNHDDHAQERFSDLLDGTLPERERRSVLDHLDACAACRSAYEAFERSTGALRALRLAPTTDAHVGEIMAALAPAAASPVRRMAPIFSHAAALALGLGLALGLRGCREDAPAPEVGERVVEVVREVPIEVPVEVRVEVPVKVPVEVVREVPVEVPIEVLREVPVERIRYVDRPVENPLQLDAERALRLLADVGGALSDVAHAARTAAARDAAELARAEEAGALAAVAAPSTGPPRAPRALAVSRPRAAPPLRILRSEGRVRIRTQGTLARVVPALIVTLDDPDPEVVRAAEEHLEALRAELDGEAGAPSTAGALAADETARTGGAWGLLPSSRGALEVEPAPGLRDGWQQWWLERSTALADAATL